MPKSISLFCRLHAKAGETVLVHGASGGVCTSEMFLNVEKILELSSL